MLGKAAKGMFQAEPSGIARAVARSLVPENDSSYADKALPPPANRVVWTGNGCKTTGRENAMKILKRILSLIDALSKCSGFAFAFVLLPLLAVVMVGVIGRYIFHAAVDFCFELGVVVFMGYFIMGGAYTLLYNAHVRMDFLYSRLSKKKQAILDLVLSTVFFFFLGLLTYKATAYAWTGTMRLETSKDFGIPMWPVMWALPVAGGLLILQGIAQFVRNLHFVITGKESL